MIQNVYRVTSTNQKSTSDVDSLDYKHKASGLTAALLEKNPKVVIKTVTDSSTKVSTYTFYKILFVVNGTAYLSDPFTPANGTMYKDISNNKVVVVSTTITPSVTLIE